MTPIETLLPRLLATVLLLLTLLTLVPLGGAVLALFHGQPVAPRAWAFPLAILGTAALMSWLLTRRLVSLQLYLAAFSLWVVTAGYLLLRFFAG